MLQSRVIVATPHGKDLGRCQQIIDGMDDLKLAGHAPSLMHLFSSIESNPPSLVLLSDELCNVPEIEVIMTMFKTLDIRWTIFESSKDARQHQQRQKPPSDGGLFSIALDSDLRALIVQLRGVLSAPQSPQTRSTQPLEYQRRRYKRMVMLGSSTGGVEALKVILSNFHADCPPTVIVQHTGNSFGTGLSTVLSRSSGACIKMFEPNQKLESGTVHIVAGHAHHVVFSGRNQPYLAVCNDPPLSGHTPSIDKMFLSAVPFASRIVAAVLTGMGSDGANGLLALRNAGARTMAQDEKTSVVYGMPAFAYSNGGAMAQVALEKIGPSLLAEAAR